MSDSQKTKHVSGEAAVLARRYAGAFYELAEGEKMLDAAANDLRALMTVADESAEFKTIANHPRLTRKQLVQAAGTVASTLKLNALTGKFLSLVAEHRRLVILPAIIDAFLAQLAASRGEYSATVRTASALNPQQMEQLSARLAMMAGGKVHLDIREDKSLIGGLTVRMGSRLIDSSIKSKLERLERKLKSEAA